MSVINGKSMRVGNLRVVVEADMLRFEAANDEGKIVVGCVFSLRQQMNMTTVESLSTLMKDVVRELDSVMDRNRELCPQCSNCGDKFWKVENAGTKEDIAAHKAGFCTKSCHAEHKKINGEGVLM